MKYLKICNFPGNDINLSAFFRVCIRCPEMVIMMKKKMFSVSNISCDSTVTNTGVC